MNGTLQRTLDFADEVQSYPVRVAYRKVGWTIALEHGQNKDQSQGSALTLVRREGSDFAIALDAVTVRGAVVRLGDDFHVFASGAHAVLRYQDPMAHAGEEEAEGGRLTAPMPGKIVAIHVEQGQSVAKGAPLLVMEAMKMEHTIAAPSAGIIGELLFAVGDQVGDGAQLLTLTIVVAPLPTDA
jgi:3-methylcrotonyl-CoA carboxylase alpha subunit